MQALIATLFRVTIQQLATRIDTRDEDRHTRCPLREEKQPHDLLRPSSCRHQLSLSLCYGTPWCSRSVQPRLRRLERIHRTSGTLFRSERQRLSRKAARNPAECGRTVNLPSHPYVGISRQSHGLFLYCSGGEGPSALQSETITDCKTV